MKKFLLIFAVMMTSQGVLASGDVFDSVYYKLYKRRFEIAEIQVKKQIKELEQDKRVLVRHKVLLEKDSIALIRYEETKLRYEVSQLKVEDLKAKLLEAQAMLDIVVDRVTLGLDMPICPSVPNQ